MRIPALLILLIACNTFDTSMDGLMPQSNSEPGELIVVMDSVHWSGDLGQVLNETFRSTVDGLPRPEPLFNVHQIQPQSFQSLLKYGRNIIVVYVADNPSSAARQVRNYFTKKAQATMAADTSKFMVTRKDVWAKDQDVLFLYGQNEEILANHIQTNQDIIRQHFNNIEQRFVKTKTYRVTEMNTVGDQLESHHGFRLRVPYGWRIEYEDENEPFVWLRSPGLDIDKSIWVSYVDYEGPQAFDHPIRFRNEVTKQHIYDDKSTNDTSYVVVETIIPPVVKEVSFGGQYAKEIRGLWKTNNLSMGGPFISYLVADPYSQRLYYLDGFVYSPGKSQRETIRELQVILNTFSTSRRENLSYRLIE